MVHSSASRAAIYPATYHYACITRQLLDTFECSTRIYPAWQPRTYQPRTITSLCRYSPPCMHDGRLTRTAAAPATHVHPGRQPGRQGGGSGPAAQPRQGGAGSAKPRTAPWLHTRLTHTSRALLGQYFGCLKKKQACGDKTVEVSPILTMEVEIAGQDWR